MGNASYRGEQLLMWFPFDPSGVLTEPVGIYHGRFNSLPSNPGVITAQDAAILASRRPAEVLLLSTTGAQFETDFQCLAPYRPVLVRTAVMHQGGAVLHVWLIRLEPFAQPRCLNMSRATPRMSAHMSWVFVGDIGQVTPLGRPARPCGRVRRSSVDKGTCATTNVEWTRVACPP